ncbi:MAG: hypothetical protein GXY03_11570 [Solirubrobacterales bacterium]|nr:hypothetical protein [Solirubrobacterales bacterium]
MTLEERIRELHQALHADGVPHAFGGALALAFWVLQPRGTADIDVNIFLPAAECGRALAVLPAGVEQPEGTEDQIRRDGQIRLWWDGTPVDLFFDYAQIHADAARDRVVVPFVDGEIPILGPIELAVFKAMFDRTKDWADIEAMIVAQRLDLEAVRDALREMVGQDDHRIGRLAEARRLAERQQPPG